MTVGELMEFLQIANTKILLAWGGSGLERDEFFFQTHDLGRACEEDGFDISTFTLGDQRELGPSATAKFTEMKQWLDGQFHTRREHLKRSKQSRDDSGHPGGTY